MSFVRENWSSFAKVPSFLAWWKVALFFWVLQPNNTPVRTPSIFRRSEIENPASSRVTVTHYVPACIITAGSSLRELLLPWGQAFSWEGAPPCGHLGYDSPVQMEAIKEILEGVAALCYSKIHYYRKYTLYYILFRGGTANFIDGFTWKWRINICSTQEN